MQYPGQPNTVMHQRVRKAHPLLVQEDRSIPANSQHRENPRFYTTRHTSPVMFGLSIHASTMIGPTVFTTTMVLLFACATAWTSLSYITPSRISLSITTATFKYITYPVVPRVQVIPVSVVTFDDSRIFTAVGRDEHERYIFTSSSLRRSSGVVITERRSDVRSIKS